MKINDTVFGELEFDYMWSKDTAIEFFGGEVNIALIVDGEEDGEFSEKQYASYNTLKENWGGFSAKYSETNFRLLQTEAI